MNTKKTALLSTLALILATSASAQVTSILPGGRGNIFIGTPMNLPGPVSGPVIAPRISLPAPLLTPAVAMAPAPAPTPVQVPVPVIPVIPALPPLPVSVIPEHLWKLSAHENVKLAYPALRATMAAPAKDASTQDPAARGEKLDDLFDGRRSPSRKSDDLGPVRSDRHQSLPEQDLESEIGAY